MVILSAFIGLVGIYLMGYMNHLDEVKRHARVLELEEFHKIENHIKELHNKGVVFKDGDII